jgi:hypothetical protein
MGYLCFYLWVLIQYVCHSDFCNPFRWPHTGMKTGYIICTFLSFDRGMTEVWPRYDRGMTGHYF